MRPAIEYRLRCAECMYWANSTSFTGPASIREKLQAWARGPQASAAFGSRTWALNSEVLPEIWCWELKWLRRVFRVRWDKAKLTYIEFMRSSAAKIKHWFHVNKIQPIHVRVLVGYYSAGWRDEHVEVAGGETPLTWAKLLRARCLRETLKAEPFAQRRRQGWAQRSQGQKLA